MRRAAARTAIAAAGAVLFGACTGSTGAAAVGSYALDVDAFIASVPAMAAVPPEVRKSIHGALELRADHTSHMSLAMPMAKVDEQGTWQLEGDLLRLSSTKGGKEEVKNGQLKDGVITFASEQGPVRLELKFRRQ